MNAFVRLIGCCLLAAIAPAVCRADGGVVRAIEHCGPWKISAFTSPNPLTAGPLDISLLVQDAHSEALVPQATLEVTIVQRGRSYGSITLPATAEAATNKLYRACLVELARGSYDVSVECQADGASGTIRFAIEVGPEPPRLAVLWPWFAWPAIPILLFGLHCYVSRPRPTNR